MALTWPSILKVSSEQWDPNTSASRGGGRSLSNDEQVLADVTGYTTATLTVPCKTRETVRAMRGLLGGLDGRAGSVLVAPCEITRSPRAPDGSSPGFQLQAPAPMNATQLTLARDRAGPVLPGMLFSVGGRLHVITRLLTADPAGAGNLTVSFRPWLRADYPAGTPIQFDHPNATMRLATNDTGKLMLALSRYGEVTLDLVEASADLDASA